MLDTGNCVNYGKYLVDVEISLKTLSVMSAIACRAYIQDAGSMVCEEEAAVVTILRLGRELRSLQCEGLNGVAGIDGSGTLVSGIHSVCNSAGRPAVTDTSQRADSGICDSIDVRIQLLKQIVVSRSYTDHNQRLAVYGTDIAVTIDTGQVHRSVAEAGQVLL